MIIGKKEREEKRGKQKHSLVEIYILFDVTIFFEQYWLIIVEINQDN
jgi:hypothetical protein